MRHSTCSEIRKFQNYQYVFKFTFVELKQWTSNYSTATKSNCRDVSYLRTTTIGLSLPVTTIRPFHIISAEETIIAKFKH